MNGYFAKEDMWMENNQMKRVLYHSSLEKCTLKPQWDTKTHPEEYLRSKRLSISVADDLSNETLTLCCFESYN